MFIGHKPGVLIVRLDGPVQYTECPEGQEPPLITPIPSLPSQLCVRFPGFYEDSGHLSDAAVTRVRQCIEDLARAFKSMAQTQRALGRCLYGAFLDYQRQAHAAQKMLHRANDEQSKWSCSVTVALLPSRQGHTYHCLMPLIASCQSLESNMSKSKFRLLTLQQFLQFMTLNCILYGHVIWTGRFNIWSCAPQCLGRIHRESLQQVLILRCSTLSWYESWLCPGWGRVLKLGMSACGHGCHLHVVLFKNNTL